MKRSFFALLMVAAMVVSSSACSNNVTSNGTTPGPMKSDTTKTGEAEPVTLKIWAPENQIQTGTLDSMTKSFQALHPEWNITFNVETQGEDTLKDEILKDVSAAGDVFFFASDQLNELINAGAIARLGGSTEEMVRSTMGESVVKTVTKDDAIYGIPFTHNTFIMYYDKSLLNAEDIKSVEGIMAKDTGDKVYNFCFDPAP